MRLNPTHWAYILCHFILVILGYFFCTYHQNDLFFAAGGSLLAAGLSGWVVFVYMLIAEGQGKTYKALDRFGFVDAFAGRSVLIKEQYETRLRSARECIDIVGFGQAAFREDFKADFASWERKLKVRILLLDPEYPSPSMNYADQRDKEEDKHPSQICSDVRKFISDCQSIFGSGKHPNFEIRLYTCLPSLSLLRIDDELFWGPYLLSESSRNTPTFLVKRGGILFEKYTGHFDLMWSKWSRPVPETWLTPTE